MWGSNGRWLVGFAVAGAGLGSLVGLRDAVAQPTTEPAAADEDWLTVRAVEQPPGAGSDKPPTPGSAAADEDLLTQRVVGATSPAAGATPAHGADAAVGARSEGDGIDAELASGIAVTLTGVGTTVGLLISALRMSQLNGDSGLQRYRAGVPTDQSACSRARGGVEVPGAATASSVADLCDEADVLEVLSATALPLSAALLAFGSYLILDSRTVAGPARSGWLLPVVGPRGAGLTAGYRF